MAIFDLFSKRQKRMRGDIPDVYVYDELPQPLRVQLVHIISDAFGVDRRNSRYARGAYEFVNKTLCREFGTFELIKNSNSEQEAIFNFFLRENVVERALDVVELCFHVIVNVIANDGRYQYHTDIGIGAEDAVAELNARFKEHGVGYQFESGEIIRVDSAFLHSEAVKPTLAVLRNKEFKGANEEFLKAHEHYRHGRHKECLVDALKAFESTMKTICCLRGWQTQPSDTAKNLIATCLSNGLFPAYLESQFSSVRALLESGIPTVRNKNGGHGQGATPLVVPEYMARYALNITATSILFMVDCHCEAK